MPKKKPKNVEAKREIGILDKFKEKRQNSEEVAPKENVSSNSKINPSNVDAEKEINILERLYNSKNKFNEAKENEDLNKSSEEDNDNLEEKTSELEKEALEERKHLLEIDDASDLENDKFWEYYIITALEEELGFLSLSDGSLFSELNKIVEEYAEDEEMAKKSLKQGVRNVRKRFKFFIEEFK